MSRPRGDPVKIRQAQRAGTRERLVSSGVNRDRADELLEAFEALPERPGQAWDSEEAYRWVLAQPRRR